MATQKPDYIIETSWEVCNKIGGIYAVLSTRAKEMAKYVDGRIAFIGPDIWKTSESPYFTHTAENPEFSTYVKNNYGLSVRIGRWNVPGKPLAILVDFTPLLEQKNDIYATMWQQFKVDSLHAYGDYDEASMFGYAAGMVVAAYIHYHDIEKKTVAAHFNEWMTAFGLFYLKLHEPQVATLFTTHATTVGRSIAGNGKALYDYMTGYFGDQMAEELNVQSKHSVEKQAAHAAHCFTTVSQITDDECAQLLERRADVVTPNGFELDFVPKGEALTALATKSRLTLIETAGRITGRPISPEASICAISGRYEYKNKGIDLFINALNRLNHNHEGREIIAFFLIPGWQDRPNNATDTPDHITTHHLCNPQSDMIMNALKFYGLNNDAHDRVKVIFVPAYLHGNDGVFNTPYYDLLAGFDFTVFPSYYEPWGYTPMESVAFGVPTVTTNLSGFGRWINPAGQSITEGVGVIPRTDSNFDFVSSRLAEEIDTIAEVVAKADTTGRRNTIGKIRKAAQRYATAAQWKNFFKYYAEAYSIAIENNKANLKNATSAKSTAAKKTTTSTKTTAKKTATTATKATKTKTRQTNRNSSK